MRPILCTVLFSLSLFIATAQNKPAKFSISAEAGPSFPQGRFGDNEYFSNYEGVPNPLGLAKTGVSFSVIPAMSFSNNVSVLLQIGGAFYERDNTAQSEFYKMIYGPGNVAVSKSTWKLFKLMPGVAYTFKPENSRFTLEPRVSLGLVKTKRPGHTVTVSSGGNPYLTRTIDDQNIPAAFCFELAASVGYQISPGIGIHVGLCYFTATAKDKVTVTGVPGTDPENVTVRYDLNNIGILAGIRIAL